MSAQLEPIGRYDVEAAKFLAEDTATLWLPIVPIRPIFHILDPAFRSRILLALEPWLFNISASGHRPWLQRHSSTRKFSLTHDPGRGYTNSTRLGGSDLAPSESARLGGKTFKHDRHRESHLTLVSGAATPQVENSEND